MVVAGQVANVETGIRGLTHSAGEPVVVVLAPLRGGAFFSPLGLSLLQVRKRLNNGVDHDDRQCEFTSLLRIFVRNLIYSTQPIRTFHTAISGRQ
ncbi:hypothetical protein B6Q59_26765 [Escherichia coli]|nr:hypothetical protein [Escherichia coli]EFO2868297.1 hypothetical protein [Escherichia coli]